MHHIDPTLVRIGVVDHESCPLRHLTEMPEGVVEVLDRGDVGLRRKVERVLQSCEDYELAYFYIILYLIRILHTYLAGGRRCRAGWRCS